MFSFAKRLRDTFEGTHVHENDSYFKNTLYRNHGYALRIINVDSDSVAARLGFESWFDYIVGIANHDLPVRVLEHQSHSYLINDDGSFTYGQVPISEQAQMTDYDMIAQELASIASSPNPTVNFEVWNAKGGVLRTIKVSLTNVLGLDPTQTPKGTLRLNVSFDKLGLTVQTQHIDSATFVWKVLNIQQGLPAFQALLVPFSDFIIGCDSAFSTDEPSTGLLANGGEHLLSKTISSYYKRHSEILHDDNVPIVLYVYNHEYDLVRPVTVHLSNSWTPAGKRGILGCDVGYGLLHRLPVVVGKFDTTINVSSDETCHNEENHTYNFDTPKAQEVSFIPIQPETREEPDVEKTHNALDQTRQTASTSGAEVSSDLDFFASLGSNVTQENHDPFISEVVEPIPPSVDTILAPIPAPVKSEVAASVPALILKPLLGAISVSSPPAPVPVPTSSLPPESVLKPPAPIPSAFPASIPAPVPSPIPVQEMAEKSESRTEQESLVLKWTSANSAPVAPASSSASVSEVVKLTPAITSAPPPANAPTASLGSAPPCPQSGIINLAPPPPRVGRRKRPIPSANMSALTSIMNEELEKSKKEDYQLVPETKASNGYPPPPPPPPPPASK